MSWLQSPDQIAQESQEYRARWGFPKRAFWCFVYTVLQKKKEAIESGKQQTENTLKEGNDILDEARHLADEINSVIVVSILWSPRLNDDNDARALEWEPVRNSVVYANTVTFFWV